MTYQPLNIIPGPSYTSTDQYVVVDPTAPNHIHVRGGGAIDNCSAELYLGGEDNHFMVYDPAGTATITAQNAIYAAEVPIVHGPFGTNPVMYQTLGADNIAAAGTATFALGAQGSFGTFKCIIHSRDDITGDTEAFEYLITEDGAGNIGDLAYTGVDSGAGALATAATSISGGDVTLTLTNVAVSTNAINVRVHVIALALA